MNFTKLIKNPSAYFLVAQKKATNIFRTHFFKGSKVYCVICGWKGLKFFDGHCPKCNSLSRTRLIPFALRYFELTKNEPKILHVAPNVNEYTYVKRQITPLANYDRLNIRPVKHINLMQDLTATTLQSDTYDLVIAWHVLEHIPKDKEAIKEVYRLLKPNGHFLVSVPIFPIGNLKTFEDLTIPYNQYEKIHGHYDHCRSCGLDYYQRFESVGFKTIELRINNIPKEQQEFNGLKNDHVVWCFQK